MTEYKWYTTTFTVPGGTELKDEGELYHPSTGQYVKYRNLQIAGNRTGKTYVSTLAMLRLLRPERHRLKIMRKALLNYQEKLKRRDIETAKNYDTAHLQNM